MIAVTVASADARHVSKHNERGIRTLPAKDRSPEEIEGLVQRLESQRRELAAQNRRLQQHHDRADTIRITPQFCPSAKGRRV